MDVAAPPHAAATGVALTRTDVDGVAHVLTLAALSTGDNDPVPRLLLELVAAVRRTEAVALEVRCRRPDLLAHLAVEDVEHTGDRVVLRF